MLWLHAGHAALHKGDGVGRQQLRKGRRHLLLAGRPAQQLVQQRLEHKAVALVDQGDLGEVQQRGRECNRSVAGHAISICFSSLVRAATWCCSTTCSARPPLLLPTWRQLTLGLVPRGQIKLSSLTAVYSPPKPPPRMHTRGPVLSPAPAAPKPVAAEQATDRARRPEMPLPHPLPLPLPPAGPL